ncbi:hypothetical protein CYMTET_21511 [Cymbomonas tetramitiformis]|uniref:Uncharacterized protein n=1 Tax=Cymbomonas tetramitiformis TaxID=36881 RepID=A0AAE0L2T5_9CHLO|nr:hypothetical protein CYMTET_21511 [Cymbomonas tetramitiformis]
MGRVSVEFVPKVGTINTLILQGYRALSAASATSSTFGVASHHRLAATFWGLLAFEVLTRGAKAAKVAEKKSTPNLKARPTFNFPILSTCFLTDGTITIASKWPSTVLTFGQYKGKFVLKLPGAMPF